MDLAGYVGLRDRSDVTNHIKHIKAAGIKVEFDKHYKYYVLPDIGFKELRYLAPLNKADKARIKGAFSQFPAAEALQLGNKIDSLIEYQKLGIEALRRPELEKLIALEEAMRKKKCVALVNYRSRNSNVERNREVEVFSIEPELGMVKAYDREKLRPAHFMLSRTDRITILDDDWKFEQVHYNLVSDAFNIVDNNQVLVDLTLKVSAYNDLIERNPGARQFTRKGSAENTYQFQAKINARFIGLRQFIFANWRDVTIHSPSALQESLAGEAREMLEMLSGE